MAFYEMEQGNYSNAVQYIERSLEHFEKINSKNEDRTAAASYQVLGDVYFKLNNYTRSENYYRKAQEPAERRKLYTGLVYNGLGGIRLKQQTERSMNTI
jgi:tetratricopeptide (TPR) repeat protein